MARTILRRPNQASPSMFRCGRQFRIQLPQQPPRFRRMPHAANHSSHQPNSAPCDALSGFFSSGRARMVTGGRGGDRGWSSRGRVAGWSGCGRLGWWGGRVGVGVWGGVALGVGGVVWGPESRSVARNGVVWIDGTGGGFSGWFVDGHHRTDCVAGQRDWCWMVGRLPSAWMVLRCNVVGAIGGWSDGSRGLGRMVGRSRSDGRVSPDDECLIQEGHMVGLAVLESWS